jgi:hypothetical protein
MIAALDGIKLANGFPEFVQLLEMHSVPLHIVSDGLDFYIDAFLKKAGLGHLDVHANRAHFDGDGFLDLYIGNYRLVSLRDQPNTKFLTVPTDAERKAFASEIRRLDAYAHPTSCTPIPPARSTTACTSLSSVSLHSRTVPADRQHGPRPREVLRWVGRSAEAAHPWVVTLDEIGPAAIGVQPDADDPSHDAIRKQALWGTLMGGGAGVDQAAGRNEIIIRIGHDYEALFD